MDSNLSAGNLTQKGENVKILAKIHEGDIPSGTLFLLGYEIAKDFETLLPMYLGIRTDGEEDIIFDYVTTKKEVIEKIETTWGHWDTFQYIDEIEEEEYYE